MTFIQNVDTVEIIIGQIIGLLHQVHQMGFQNLIKQEIHIIGEFGGVKSLLKISTLKYHHL